MIIRVFCARLRPGKRGAYERLCQEKSVPIMRGHAGFLTHRIAAPRPDQPNDLVFVSVWQDLASVQAFAGDHWEEASILPGEAELLEAASVRHFDESYQSLVEMWSALSAVVKQREIVATTAPLTDAQWARIQPTLARMRRSRGRPRADDRRVLDGILYVLRTGNRWNQVPAQYASPATCWRRFAQWEREGVWEQIWRALISQLDSPGKQAWALAFLDSRHIPTKRRRKPLARVIA